MMRVSVNHGRLDCSDKNGVLPAFVTDGYEARRFEAPFHHAIVIPVKVSVPLETQQHPQFDIYHSRGGH